MVFLLMTLQLRFKHLAEASEFPRMPESGLGGE